MRRTAVTALGGKVRVEPEFLPLAYGEPCLSFARWLDAGMAHALDHEGAAWRERFLRSSAQAFVYYAAASADDATTVLVGVLGPSEDRSARPYPFAVMSEVREPEGNAASLPVASERFLATAASVCREGRSARRAADVVARAQELVPPTREEHQRAARDLADWKAKEGICASLWARLFTSGATGAELCFRELVATRRTRLTDTHSLAVRLPLGGGGAAAAAFWIDVLRALFPSRTSGVGVFWPSDGAAGTVLIELGEPRATSFAEIWSREERDPRVLDLGVPEPRSSDELPPVDAAIGDVLSNPSARVGVLLEALASA